MGFIAALIRKTGEDVSKYLLRVLEAASPSRGDGHGVGTPDGVKYFSPLPDTLSFGSDVMLGHRLVKIMPNDPPQPISQQGYTMIFEGRLWGGSASSNFTAAADVVGTDPFTGIQKLIEAENGSYAVVAAEKGRLLCGRDLVGVVPLYFGENETLAAVASNRKMLWAVSVKAELLPPGCMAEMTKNGVCLHQIRSLRQPPTRTVAMEEAVEELDGLLFQAVEARCKGLFSASLGFSGGIDSSLLAYYLDQCGVEVDLVCVGVEGSSEFEAAAEAAENLDLPIRLMSFPPAEVEKDLEEVLCSVEEPDPMKVSIALPLHWAARSAIAYGNRVFFSGNASDELFGGYLKYVREHAASGSAVRETMFRDVAAAHTVNYERDFKVCSDLGVELRLPFADPRLIEFGLSLPVELKFSANEGSPRKLLLRNLGMKIGLPDSIAFRRKRAIQYSTGVSRILKRHARGAGTTPSRYLTARFDRIKEKYMELGPGYELSD